MDRAYVCHMTNTAATQTQTIGIEAARIGRGDIVEIEGEFRTVDDYEWTADRRILWTLTDGSTFAIAPHRFVAAVA